MTQLRMSGGNGRSPSPRGSSHSARTTIPITARSPHLRTSADRVSGSSRTSAPNLQRLRFGGQMGEVD